jgi:hypothetical protein
LVQARSLVREAHDEVAELAKKALEVTKEKQIECAKKNIPDLQATVGALAKKVPTLDALERKLDMMNDMHPELKVLEKDLNEITDFSDMKLAHKGGETIRKALDKKVQAEDKK